jgi:hypothetical protein
MVRSYAWLTLEGAKDGSELGATDDDTLVLIVGKEREALGAANGLELGKIKGAKLGALFGSPSWNSRRFSRRRSARHGRWAPTGNNRSNAAWTSAVPQADAEADVVRIGIIDAAIIGTADGALDGWFDWDALRLLEGNRMGTIEGATLVPLVGLSDVVLLGSAHGDAEGDEIVRIEGSIVGVVLGSALVL